MATDKKTILAKGKGIEAGENRFDALLSQIREKYGDVIGKGSKVKVYERFIPTGALDLDYALGGGVPIGRVALFHGYKASGKTTTMQLTVGQAQHICRFCCEPLYREPTTEWLEWVEWCLSFELNPYDPDPYTLQKLRENDVDVPERPAHYSYYHVPDEEGREATHEPAPFRTTWQDAEGGLEKEWAELCGVDMDHVYILRTEYAEQGIDVGDAVLRSQECEVLAVDSLANMTPMVEIEETAENWQVGVQARLLNKAMRKWVSAIASLGVNPQRPRPTVLMSNHIHINVGQMFGNPETLPGGKNQEYAAHVMVKFKTPTIDMSKVAGNEVSDASTIRFVVTKNRIVSVKREGEYKIWTRATDGHPKGSIEETVNVLKKANALGFVAKDPWRCTLFEESTFKTKTELQEFMSQGQTFARVRQAVLRRMLEL